MVESSSVTVYRNRLASVDNAETVSRWKNRKPTFREDHSHSRKFISRLAMEMSNIDVSRMSWNTLENSGNSSQTEK